MPPASTQGPQQGWQQHIQQPATPLASASDPQEEWQRRPQRQGDWGGVHRRVELAAGLFALLVQLAVWGRTAPTLGLRGQLHQAAMVLIQSGCVGLTLFLPHDTWRHYRVWLITVLRLCIVLVPSHRSAQEGTAVLLHRAATTGLGGALVDYLRVALGTRVLLQTVAGFILHQPPLVVLLQQCAIMALISNSQGYCACPLLDNPLVTRRLALLARCLEAIPLFTVPLTSTATLHDQNHSRRTCAALLYMHQAVVGVLLPTVLASCTWGAADVPPPPRQPRLRQRSALWEKLCDVASKLEALWQQANNVVREVCTGAELPAVQLALAAWLLIGNLWMLAVAMAERDP